MPGTQDTEAWGRELLHGGEEPPQPQATLPVGRPQGRGAVPTGPTATPCVGPGLVARRVPRRHLRFGEGTCQARDTQPAGEGEPPAETGGPAHQGEQQVWEGLGRRSSGRCSGRGATGEGLARLHQLPQAVSTDRPQPLARPQRQGPLRFTVGLICGKGGTIHNTETAKLFLSVS